MKFLVNIQKFAFNLCPTSFHDISILDATAKQSRGIED